jgi:hypothetical protein
VGEDPAKTDPNALLLTVWQFATAYEAAMGALRRREAVARAKAGGAGAR